MQKTEQFERADRLVINEAIVVEGRDDADAKRHENEPRLAVPSCHGMMVR